MKQTQVEPYQGAYLSIVLCFGGLGAVSAIGSKLGHEVWLTMLPAAVAGVLLFFCYVAALKKCGARDLVEITLLAFGQRGGKIVLTVYLACFLCVSSYYLLAIIDLWMLMGAGRTPLAVYIALVLLVIVLIARMGLPVIGRMVGFFVLFYFLMTLVDTLFLLPEMQWQRILPLQVSNPARLLEDSLYITVLMFGLLPLALSYLPQLTQPQQGKKCLGIGMAAVFGELLLANLRNVFLFGDALRYEDYPTYQALRLVEWGSGILRLELLGVIAALAMVLLFGALVFYAMGSLLAAVSGQKNSRMLAPLAVVAGLMMYVMKNSISFIDNTALLIALVGGSGLILLLLFATILKLQKCDCQ